MKYVASATQFLDKYVTIVSLGFIIAIFQQRVYFKK